MTKSETMYTATFSRPLDLSERDASVLRQTEDGGPLYLSEVTDLCAGMSVRAELFDVETNARRGTVDAKGNYALT